MMKLTLQTHWNYNWHDAATLTLVEPEKGLAGRCRVDYLTSYLFDKAEHYHQKPFKHALSANIPLCLDGFSSDGLPAFLYDILPAGASRRALLRNKDYPQPVDLQLLHRATKAPIGHLRVSESAEDEQREDPVSFVPAEITEHHTQFLQYAMQRGADISAATGAGGEAPKLLLVEDRQGRLFLDAELKDAEAAKHWLVKFPRNKGNSRDQAILRSEYLYYKALSALGFSTLATDDMRLEEEGERPSLWVRRFDRKIHPLGVQRLAMESHYSLANVSTPGSYMRHEHMLERLVALWQQAGQGDQIERMIVEYLRRDLLKRVLGDSDNHGRNSAVIRGTASVELAPLYDLAPMVMDDEGISRSTKWNPEIEAGGRINWRQLCQSLNAWVDPDNVFTQLQQTAQCLRALPDVLMQSGLPPTTMMHPGVPLRRLDAYFKQEDLL